MDFPLPTCDVLNTISTLLLYIIRRLDRVPSNALLHSNHITDLHILSPRHGNLYR